jgi:hypothetical protein
VRPPSEVARAAQQVELLVEGYLRLLDRPNP